MRTAVMGLAAVATLIMPLTGTADDSIEGLVAWWRAEGNASDSIGDSEGVVTGGASFGHGVHGRCFTCDGVSGYIAVSNAVNMDFGTNDFTVSAWARWASAAGGLTRDQTILSRTGGSYPNDWGYFLEYVSGEPQPVLRFVVLDTRSNINDLMAPAPLAVDHWFHVAAVRTGNTSRIYLDGRPLAEQTAGSNIDTRSGGSAKIGALSGVYGSARYFGGGLDEVALYGRALSDAEIYRLGTLPPQMAISSSGSEVEVSWTSQSNRHYQVLCSGDLLTNSWVTLESPVLATAKVTVVHDAISDPNTQRFYRVVTPLP